MFVYDWDQCLTKTQAQPDEDTMRCAFYGQIASHPSLRLDIACYHKLDAGHPNRSYARLKKMVEAHGGEIRAENLEAGGVQFEIWLPNAYQTTSTNSPAGSDETLPQAANY